MPQYRFNKSIQHAKINEVSVLDTTVLDHVAISRDFSALDVTHRVSLT